MTPEEFRSLAWATSARTDAWHGPMGEFQALRRRLKGRINADALFHKENVQHDYAFHRGGRTEFQLNMGLEHGGDTLRVGLAFSLESSGQVRNVVQYLTPKIERFNAIAKGDPSLLANVDLAYWVRTGTHDLHFFSPGAIDLNLAKEKTFIFLGKFIPAASVTPESLLEYWDLLLPLYEKVEQDGKVTPVSAIGGFKASGPPPTHSGPILMRPGAGVIEKKDEHDQIQRSLYGELVEEWGRDSIRWEYPLIDGTEVDIAVNEPEGLVFYEVKSGDHLKECFREALGQLLEYAHWVESPRCKRMVLVTKLPLTEEAGLFLKELNDRYNLPLDYRQVNLESGE